MQLDQQRLRQIIDELANRLSGDWLLVGGALVALWLRPRRVTEDVDIFGLAGSPGERLELMRQAQALSLPVEAVNSAADFFVRRIADWREHIEPFHVGLGARIFRPTPTLFLLLKIGRLSEQDLDDCVAMLEACAQQGLGCDHDRVARELAALPPTADVGLAERRIRLAARLQTAR